ncbi:MAG: FYDLN acid domain-containing protein [Alphaproteobacteria bacterium]|nr:FYDLN acid domain-containing protein [Alphaproteobacteria bacterium]
MAKAEWGAKHTCVSCGAKFYDMGRNPITCPACDAPFAIVAASRTRRVRKADVKEVPAPTKAKVKKKVPDGDEESLVDDLDDLVDDDEDEDDDVIALADDDDDDDDDVLAEADLSKSKISDD